MTATRLTLAAATLAASSLLLTGCDPSNTAGSPDSAGGGGITCDAQGWGPLSGCGSTGSTNTTGSADSAGHKKPASVDTPSCEADENGCVTDSSSTFKHKIQTDGQKTTETTENNVTVTVIWIVVKIDVTGFQECVISLREAPPNPDDHVSRRITTRQDCQAQHIDTVYRPVGESSQWVNHPSK